MDLPERLRIAAYKTGTARAQASAKRTAARLHMARHMGILVGDNFHSLKQLHGRK